jgi:pyruvate/2-oxoglutarate dehydrogenase complex dihydrolipoamide dehydrogenase (E3) component
MPIEHSQNLIIGCGVAGKILAWTLSKQGQRTVIVERSMIGGSCVNVGCLPSKNVIYSAKAVSLVHPTTGLGVVSGSMRVDMGAVARRKRQTVDEVIELHLDRQSDEAEELLFL